MRWKQGRLSRNVEDRRGQRARGVKIGGGAGLLLLLAVVVLGGDPTQVLQLMQGGGAPAVPAGGPPANDEESQFMSAVLAMTEDVWGEIFASSGRQYREPTLVLFTGSVESACGINTSATGPFYCPPDQRLYLDTSFFGQLARLGGPGEFAQAYVIGHEVGHHVQTLEGTSSQVRQLQSQARNQAAANRLQVAMELQADCYAGVFAYHANRRQRVLEPGDIEEGLAAAAAIGDDRLSGGRASPDSFTHGSAAQRQRWLRTGLQTGSINACNTFQ